MIMYREKDDKRARNRQYREDSVKNRVLFLNGFKPRFYVERKKFHIIHSRPYCKSMELLKKNIFNSPVDIPTNCTVCGSCQKNYMGFFKTENYRELSKLIHPIFLAGREEIFIDENLLLKLMFPTYSRFPTIHTPDELISRLPFNVILLNENWEPVSHI
jgi:hypothetical protein